MSDQAEFDATSVSTSGAPDIVYHFAGHTCRAELAGARLYCEMREDGGIDMRLTDAGGEILADIVIKERSHRNATENLTDVGSALLWSHWRFLQALGDEMDHARYVDLTLAVDITKAVSLIDTSRTARSVGDEGSAESALDQARRLLLALVGIHEEGGE